MKSKLAVFILLIALVCFGCGKNEHEVELDMDDEYGYSGTWIGQTSPTSFLILNITREGSPTSYKYFMVNLFYYLKVHGTPNEKLVTVSWELAADTRGAEVRKNHEDLILETGLTVGKNGFGARNTDLFFRRMRRDGKKLFFVDDKEQNLAKMVLEDDYDDLLDEVADLKKKIYEDLKKDVQSRYPDAHVSIIDNAKPPNMVLK
ncbi:MAG: hypothetical protein IJQ82_06860 [Selenomonadaceae bacterium]|nr:hypothetical protein [Selenomonadaceae bacterium]